jgi:hypothetical protein
MGQDSAPSARRHSRSWPPAAAAAFLGWLLVVVLLVVGVRPLGLVLLVSALVTIAATGLWARWRAVQPSVLAGFTFACIMLEWPILALVTLALAGSTSS